MKRTALCAIFLLLALLAWAFRGRVADGSGNPIIGAAVSLMKDTTVVRLVAVTDSLGCYSVEVENYPVAVRIGSLGYKTVDLRLTAEPDSAMLTTLDEDRYMLQEVEVTPEMMRHYGTHSSYQITQAEIANYANFAQALNVVPFVTVLPSGGLMYKGDPNAVVLLNGVKASWAEIRALDKGDVSKVDIYENPPAQYALAGASVVIDIITKRKITGGNVSVDLTDSFHPASGNNSVAAFYNYGSSRFSLLVDNSFDRQKKIRTDERLHYAFDGKEYDKQKTGLDSPRERDNNTVALGYMSVRPNDYQFNANLSATFYREDQQRNQLISNNGLESLHGGRDVDYRYNMQSLNLYFKKMWSGGRSFLVDATGSLYDIDFLSDYKEISPDGVEAFATRSAYTMNRRSIYSTVQYTGGSLPIGQWTLGANNSYYTTEQRNETLTIPQKNYNLYGYAQLYGGKGLFHYQLIMATKYLSIREDGRSVWSRWYPSARAAAWLRPKSNISLQLNYFYSAYSPSLSMLSETEQWLDSYYVYKGDSGLKPYSMHGVYLQGSATTRYVNLSFLGLFTYSPNAIENHFETTSRYVLQTYANLREKRELGGQLMVDIYPLGNKSLRIGVIAIYIHHRGKEKDGYTWSGYRYQLMPYALYTLPKWDFSVNYQYPGQTVYGQLVDKKTEALTLNVAFKPMPNMSIGLEWNQPFMKGWKEGEYTENNPIVEKSTFNYFDDYRNRVSLKFSYNFSFGKQQKQPSQSVRNKDEDPGLIIK